MPGPRASLPTSAPTLAPLAALWLMAAWLSGCAGVMPQESAERALYVDLRKIVETRQSTEWLLDSKEVAEAAPVALSSTCRVSPQVSASLGAWLDAQIVASGGPARATFEANGRDLDAVAEPLTLERVRAVLDHALERRAECPFWIEPEDDFLGVQGDAGRLVLFLESNGGGSLIASAGEVGFGGEGGGRFLVGWGVNDRITLSVGGEVGGRGKFEGVEGAQALSASVTAAAPLVLRLHGVSQVFDVEIAPTAASDPDKFDPRPGLRFTLAAGLSTVRVSGFMPAIMGMINYEIQPASQGLPLTQIFRIGTRFSIDYDP